MPLGSGQPARDCTVRQLFRRAADSPALRGILGVLEEEYASSRFVGDSHSSIVDLPLIGVMADNLVSVAVWYDNEYGFCCRLAETASFLAASEGPAVRQNAMSFPMLMLTLSATSLTMRAQDSRTGSVRSWAMPEMPMAPMTCR
jgi:Glyceraldehyde 3-phosphate dehydrogenase, C-terminal domain